MRRLMDIGSDGQFLTQSRAPRSPHNQAELEHHAGFVTPLTAGVRLSGGPWRAPGEQRW
jgi:hypothetical protein